MKSFKYISVSSNGSLSLKYNLLKIKNNIIFNKKDDKNFILNQKKITDKNKFSNSSNYKKKYF